MNCNSKNASLFGPIGFYSLEFIKHWSVHAKWSVCEIVAIFWNHKGMHGWFILCHIVKLSQHWNVTLKSFLLVVQNLKSRKWGYIYNVCMNAGECIIKRCACKTDKNTNIYNNNNNNNNNNSPLILWHR